MSGIQMMAMNNVPAVASSAVLVYDLDAANYDLVELKCAGFQDYELSQVCRMWDLSKMQQNSST